MAPPIAKILLGSVCTAALAIAGANYVNLQRPMSQVVQSDPRNEGIRVFVHYKYFVDPGVLVYDLREVSETSSPMDVTRIFLHFAEREKEVSFSSVELSHRGNGKFLLKGEYFHKLGQEYGSQNPAYTLRTLPENLYKQDGSPAFGTWTGGILGVLGRQMEDFTTWHRTWYIDDLTSENRDNTNHAQ